MTSVHNEYECKFVSTVGLSLICHQKPTYNGRMVHYNWNFDNRTGEIVYVKSTHLLDLASYLHHFKNPIVILANGDDNFFPHDYMQSPQWKILDSNKVLRIYIQNNWLHNHPKFHHIPIGIDYRTLNWEKGAHDWGTTGQTALQQEAELNECIALMKPLNECDATKVVTNFHLAMSSPPRRRVFREPAYQALKDVEWMIWLPQMSRKEFWMSLQDKVFVLCPPGNGPDTHRAWEVLMLGRIPIIQDLSINDVYKKLPVVCVENWNTFAKLTPEDLQQTLNGMLKQWDSYEWDRLTLNWWKCQILAGEAL